MTTAIAPELTLQASLFGGEEASFDRAFGELERTWLDDASWVDRAPIGWRDPISFFGALSDLLPWHQREVVMWERRLPEPRLTFWWDGSAGAAEPLAILGDVRDALAEHYGRSFDSIGFNLYRDGRDSVAWHSDRERFEQVDPIVAIVSVGAVRNFRLRPRDGGPSRSYPTGRGDLLVMGGTCQHRWEHCVPKAARVEGPRLSIMFRHHPAGTGGV